MEGSDLLWSKALWFKNPGDGKRMDAKPGAGAKAIRASILSSA